jgi:transposase
MSREQWLKERKTQIETMYNAFMSQEEIAQQLGVYQNTISLFMKKNGIKARVAVKRDQRGEKNHTWTGDKVSYKGGHDRVRSARGAPKKCVKCSTIEGRLEWASINKKYYDPNDYQAMCVPCHRRYDMNARIIKIKKECPVCNKEWLVTSKDKKQIHCSSRCSGEAQSAKLDHNKVIKLYLFGYSKKQIADKYNLSQSPIDRILKIHDVPVRSKSNRGYYE